MVEIQVIDTGIGIDPTVLPLVFDEFYQASSELTRRYGGSGLGLAISRRLVELMDGQLMAASELGLGSVFSIRLRVAEAGSELRAEDIALHGAWAGPARLHLVPHVNCRVADLPVRKVLFGRHIIADLTLPYGEVLFDYLA